MPEIEEVMIAGEWVPPAARETRVVLNPSTLRPLGVVGLAEASQWREALRAAGAAATAWRQRRPEERVALLARVGERLLAIQDELALIHARESGQVITEALDGVRDAAACWRIAAASASAPTVSMVWPRSDGTLLDWSRIVSERLAGGGTCIVALPAEAPLSVLGAARCCAALPHGVLSVLVGEPVLVPDAGVEHVRPADEPVATDIVYVSPDADLNLAVAGVSARRLYHSGQRAGQSVRVYVERSRIYAFADRLHESLAFLEVGDAVKPGSDLGPLASAARLQQVEAQVAAVLRRGALIKLGGRRYQPWGLTGYFFQPTLMIEGTGEERAPEDRIRGPVIVLSPARDLAAAIADRPAAAPVRISLFAGDVPRALAGVDAEPHRVQIEPVVTRGADWFPYQARSARR